MKTAVCSFLCLATAGIALAASGGKGGWDLSQPLNSITFERAKAVREPSPDRPAPRFSRLHNIKGRAGARSATSTLDRVLRTPPSHHSHTYQNVSTAGDFSTQYAVQCGWDGVPVWLLFDTGSSDTWAVQTGFECDGYGSDHSEAACGFGTPLVDGFAEGPIEDLHFFLRYGSGEKNAIPPRFAVVIAGVDFWVNPADLMYQDFKDPLTGYCAVAIASGGSGPYILGDVFLQNVVAVFNVGAAQMRFYSRQ